MLQTEKQTCKKCKSGNDGYWSPRPCDVNQCIECECNAENNYCAVINDKCDKCVNTPGGCIIQQEVAKRNGLNICVCPDCVDIGTYGGFHPETGENADFCAVCNKPRRLTKEQSDAVLQQARETYGYANQILVTIEELNELSCALAKYPRYNNHKTGLEKTRTKVIEEVADVLVVLEHVYTIFDLDPAEVAAIIDKKVRRLKKWLQNSDSLQYTTECRE